jgi:hypothetical protein
MQPAKIFKWNDKVVPLSDVNNLSYTLQEIQQSGKFNSTELQTISTFNIDDIKFFVSDVLLPDYDDFKTIAVELLDRKGEISSKEIKDILRNNGAWITQKDASEWIKKFAKDKRLVEEKVAIDKSKAVTEKNNFYILYKEDIKPDPNGAILIL